MCGVTPIILLLTEDTQGTHHFVSSLARLNASIVLTFTGPALLELKRKDDIILILAELTDEAFGLAQLWRRVTVTR